MLGKLADGASMVWATLDDRERFLLLYGGLLLLFGIASVLSTPRRRDDDERGTLPVVLVVREREAG